jgi:hypothetical protein
VRNADGSLAAPPLGFPRGPEDLLVDNAGEALRLDRSFSWEAPIGIHSLMHMAISPRLMPPIPDEPNTIAWVLAKSSTATNSFSHGLGRIRTPLDCRR